MFQDSHSYHIVRPGLENKTNNKRDGNQSGSGSPRPQELRQHSNAWPYYSEVGPFLSEALPPKPFMQLVSAWLRISKAACGMQAHLQAGRKKAAVPLYVPQGVILSCEHQASNPALDKAILHLQGHLLP